MGHYHPNTGLHSGRIEASTSTRPSPGKVLISLTLLPPLISPCPGRHAPGFTFSRLGLILVRDWHPEDVRGLLGPAEVQAPRQDFPREVFPGGGDRFCLHRVALAEIADHRLNRRLSPDLQGARSQVGEGIGAFLRYGLGQWLTVLRSDVAEEGVQVEVASASGELCQRTVESVGAGWNGVSLVSLAPTSLERRAGTHPQPSLHGLPARGHLGRTAQPQTPGRESAGRITPVSIHPATMGSGALVWNQT